MEKIIENLGVFSVELNAEINKYVIVYFEKGEKIILDGEEYIFDNYDAADDYVKTHAEELNEVVSKYKKSSETVPGEVTNEEEQEPIVDDKNKKDKKKNKKDKKKNKKDKNKNKKDKKKNKAKKSGWFITFLSGFLAAVITLVGGHYIAKGISASIKESKNESYISGESMENGETEDPSLIGQEKPLTTEEFEKVTTEFTKLYTDKSLNISTKDLVKFVSIVNIDKLVEDNPELASQLFDGQSKEEYLNDAAKVIGLTYTYNRNVYNETGKTDGFIRISNAVSGDQKYALQIVETYVDLIATYSYDVEQANLYITSLINDLGDPNSELSYLDDGVGFGMQVCIELIRSCIAKDIISQKNLDALTLLTSSEEYVSNIFAVYGKCNPSNTKTRK